MPLLLRLGGDLDFGLLDDARAPARLALTGAVALFAWGLLHVQEFQSDSHRRTWQIPYRDTLNTLHSLPGDRKTF